MAEQAVDQQENKEQGPQDLPEELPERVQRVLNVIAAHIGTFYHQKRTGELSFRVKFDEGEIPRKGYSQTIDEDVL